MTRTALAIRQLSLKLPDKTLSVLRCFGICPEWFATEACTIIFRGMMDDESNFIATMQAWAERNGLSLENDSERTAQPQAAPA
jgi:hypothetical protein